MENFLADHGYLAVFVLSFISSMGLPVGAEVALIYGGVLASGQVTSEQHQLSLAVVIIVAVVAEVLGSLAGYLIGFYGGRPLVDKVGKYVLLTHKDLDRAEAWFAAAGRALRAVRSVHTAPPVLRLVRRRSGRDGHRQVRRVHDHRLRGVVHGPGEPGLLVGEQLRRC